MFASAPSKEARAPSKEATSTEANTPSKEACATSKETNTPSKEACAPSTEAGASSKEANAPSKEACAPSTEAGAPSKEANTPSKEACAPSNETDAPSEEAGLTPKRVNAPHSKEPNMPTPLEVAPSPAEVTPTKSGATGDAAAGKPQSVADPAGDASAKELRKKEHEGKGISAQRAQSQERQACNKQRHQAAQALEKEGQSAPAAAVTPKAQTDVAALLRKTRALLESNTKLFKHGRSEWEFALESIHATAVSEDIPFEVKLALAQHSVMAKLMGIVNVLEQDNLAPGHLNALAGADDLQTTMKRLIDTHISPEHQLRPLRGAYAVLKDAVQSS